MAKGLRSKVKRKMRAIQRKKNAPRELKKLQKVIGLTKDGKMDVDVQELVTVTDATQIKEKAEKKAMEVDSKFNKRTLKDENGHYPEWMNQRQISKHKGKKSKKKKGRHGVMSW